MFQFIDEKVDFPGKEYILNLEKLINPIAKNSKIRGIDWKEVEERFYKEGKFTLFEIKNNKEIWTIELR